MKNDQNVGLVKNTTYVEVSGVILKIFKITYKVFQDSSNFTTEVCSNKILHNMELPLLWHVVTLKKQCRLS